MNKFVGAPSIIAHHIWHRLYIDPKSLWISALIRMHENLLHSIVNGACARNLGTISDQNALIRWRPGQARP